jgi:N-acetylmuramic acid 6-phosphate etherase
LWRWADGEVRNEGRSGGWGAVLGDEGSGWSLGREGIKSVLTYTANGLPLLPWHRDILNHLGVSDPDLLLTAATRLAETCPPGPAESERKKRIAGCARIVVGAEGDEADRVLGKVAREVVDVLRPLVGRLEGDLEDTILSVTGGLGGSAFWKRVEGLMSLEGWKWHSVCYLADPAEQGLRSLLQRDSVNR